MLCSGTQIFINVHHQIHFNINTHLPLLHKWTSSLEILQTKCYAKFLLHRRFAHHILHISLNNITCTNNELPH
jgi:hypothetical protein